MESIFICSISRNMMPFAELNRGTGSCSRPQLIGIQEAPLGAIEYIHLADTFQFINLNFSFAWKIFYAGINNISEVMAFFLVVSSGTRPLYVRESRSYCFCWGAIVGPSCLPSLHWTVQPKGHHPKPFTN